MTKPATATAASRLLGFLLDLVHEGRVSVAEAVPYTDPVIAALAKAEEPSGECLACGHLLPFAVYQPSDAAGICAVCRDLALPNRGGCSAERGCSCRSTEKPDA